MTACTRREGEGASIADRTQKMIGVSKFMTATNCMPRKCLFVSVLICEEYKTHVHTIISFSKNACHLSAPN